MVGAQTLKRLDLCLPHSVQKPIKQPKQTLEVLFQGEFEGLQRVYQAIEKPVSGKSKKK